MSAAPSRLHFASSTAFREWYVNAPDPSRAHHYFYEYDRQTSVRRALASLQTGSEQYVPMIERIINEVWQTAIPTFHNTWQPSVAGAFVNLPAYLAQVPEAMFSLQPDPGPFNPLRLWVGLTSSIAIGEYALARRGAALAALASALASVRQVFLTPYTCNAPIHGRGGASEPTTLISWDVQTSPMVLSDVATNLTNPDVARHLGNNASYKLDERTSGGWPTWARDNDQTLLRQYLGADDDDLVFPTVHVLDPLVNDPVGQVKGYLAKYAVE